MMTVKTYLDKSPIDGIGVYAGEDIAKGSVIWRLEDSLDLLLDENELAKFPDPVQAYIKKYSFNPLSNPDVYILEFDNGRFMNHSDNPNTDLAGEKVGYAARDIKKGEELTCNYNDFIYRMDFLS